MHSKEKGLLLRGAFVPFLLRLLKRLVYLDNLLVFEDQDVLLRCFNSFILTCLEYCSSVWSSVADSNLKLFIRSSELVNF